MEILYSSDMQPESRRVIEQHIERLRWLLPPWLHLLRVHLFNEGDERGELASIRVMHEYREAALDICCGWLDEPPHHKLKSLIHELLHIHLNVVGDYVREKLDCIVPKEEAPRFNETLQKELTDRMEGLTHDLAKVVCDKFLSEPNTNGFARTLTNLESTVGEMRDKVVTAQPHTLLK
jgi:hypothetical protein